MEVYQTLEIRDEHGSGTGLYHYTCSNSGGTYAVGYCSPLETCPECKGRSGILRHPEDPPCEHCQDKGILRKPDACPGHATPEEAEAHYEAYLMDNARYDGRLSEDEQRKCHVCGTWTQGLVHLRDWQQYVLCDDHRNRHGLEQAVAKSKGV